MKNKIDILILFLVMIMISLNAVTIYMLVCYKSDLPNQVKSIISNNIPKIDYNAINKSITLSVGEKIDSLNLKNGEKGDKGDTGAAGINSVSTNTIEKKVVTNEVIKEVPVNGVDGKDGLSPIPVCNSAKNRWEYTYDQLTFFITLDRNGKQVKCIGG